MESHFDIIDECIQFFIRRARWVTRSKTVREQEDRLYNSLIAALIDKRKGDGVVRVVSRKGRVH